MAEESLQEDGNDIRRRALIRLGIAALVTSAALAGLWWLDQSGKQDTSKTPPPPKPIVTAPPNALAPHYSRFRVGERLLLTGHSHQAWPDVALEGRQLTCPKHQWKFDVTTGQCVEKGNRPLREFKAKVENGRLLAFW